MRAGYIMISNVCDNVLLLCFFPMEKHLVAVPTGMDLQMRTFRYLKCVNLENKDSSGAI
jgi:hypothetical protein